jgi:hypothetical protein
MQASLARVLARWDLEKGPPEDKYLPEAMLAFALEESGDYGRAAALARQVLSQHPKGKRNGLSLVQLGWG